MSNSPLREAPLMVLSGFSSLRMASNPRMIRKIHPEALGKTNGTDNENQENRAHTHTLHNG